MISDVFIFGTYIIGAIGFIWLLGKLNKSKWWKQKDNSIDSSAWGG